MLTKPQKRIISQTTKPTSKVTENTNTENTNTEKINQGDHRYNTESKIIKIANTEETNTENTDKYFSPTKYLGYDFRMNKPRI